MAELSITSKDTFGWGAFYGMVSALAYTTANICLREVSHHDPIWVAFIKSLPTMALTLPWLLLLLAKGRGVHPTPRQIYYLVWGGVIGQLGGNVCFQWSLDVIGLALAVPITTGSMILAGGVMGKVFLGESLSRQNIVANAMLVVAVCVLSLGAKDAFQAIRQSTGEGAWTMAALGIAAAFIPGIAYSIQNIMLRRMFSEGMHLSGALLTISTTGAIVALMVLGFAGRLETAVAKTDGAALGVMAGAGIFNAGAFVALSMALRMTPVWFVYALSSSQVALAAALGIWLFDEPASGALLVGVALTVVGLMTIRTRSRGRQ